MRKILALSCVAMLALSAPAFAQSSSSSNVSQPSAGTVVNYQNGLQALGQVPGGPGQDNQDIQSYCQNNPGMCIIGAGGVILGIVGGALLISHNESKSVSP